MGIEPQKVDFLYKAKLTYERLLPRLQSRLKEFTSYQPQTFSKFFFRLEMNFERLFSILYQLYGNQYDFFYHLEELLVCLGQAYAARSPSLKSLDEEREKKPLWYLSNDVLGGVCYVDLFAKNLSGLRKKIPFFKELGLTYLHLMPFYASPQKENDGGYAVSSYRQLDKKIGCMEELIELAQELRENGISLVLDFVFNHTSDEHEWAQKAKQGSKQHQAYYWFFPNRQLPDEYEKYCREIFPEEHHGCFTYEKNTKHWVWTTFHHYQWDLNYQNPEVFTRSCEEMLFLANIGVEVLRLDAVAFIWKQLGTNCENLPQAHLLIQAFNIVAKIAAPALLFKSEAIVHPDEVIRYIHPDECALSYNPLLMALLWEALATRQVKLLAASMRNRFALAPNCAWVNYVRCHDDIGWTFSDEDAAELGIDAFGHRNFLNRFYTARFEGSFARGLPFQENPRTGDCRISGTCASLAGLEKALHSHDEEEIKLAVNRILLIHGVILTIGGIPLIYLGDEIGTLNDYTFRYSPQKSHDSRWVHRVPADEKRYARCKDQNTIEYVIYNRLRQLIGIRKAEPAFWGNEMQVIDSENEHVFGYLRKGKGECVIVFANFSEHVCSISANLLRLYGINYRCRDLLSLAEYATEDELKLSPYQLLLLKEI